MQTDSSKHRNLVPILLAAVAAGLLFWLGKYLLDERSEAPSRTADSALPKPDAAPATELPPDDRVSGATETPAVPSREEASPDAKVAADASPGKAVVSGRVVEGEDRRPATQTPVRLTRQRPPLSTFQVDVFEDQGRGGGGRDPFGKEPEPPVAEATTRADGSFELKGIAPGTYFVSAKRDLAICSSPAQITIEAAGNPPAIELVLEPAGAVEGQVVDKAGHGLAAMDVSLAEPFNPFTVMTSGRLRIPDRTATDSEGRFRFPSVPKGGDYTVAAHGGDFANSSREHVEVSAGAATSVTLTMLTGASISGVVRSDEGQPVSGVKVTSFRTKGGLFNMLSEGESGFRNVATTDADGHFRIGRLHAGEYRILVASRTHVPPASQKIELADGEQRTLDLVVSRGLTVSGVVKAADEEAKPLKGAQVVAAKAQGLFPFGNLESMGDDDRSIGTDENGHFECGGLAAGELKLQVKLKGYLDHSRTVNAGDQNIEVSLDRAGSIKGIVISTVDSDPVKAYHVSVRKQGGGGFDMANMARMFERPQSVHSDDGVFVIEDLEPASYTLTVSAKGYGRQVKEKVAVQKGRQTKGIAIFLQPEGWISGQVTTEDGGRPLPGARVVRKSNDSPIGAMFAALTERSSVVADQEGKFRIGGFSTEKVVLEVSADGYARKTTGEFDVTAGKGVEDVKIVLDRGCGVRGVVLAADERPQPRATVIAQKPAGLQMGMSTCDAQGHFEILGLTPGDYQLVSLGSDFGIDPGNFMESMTQGMQMLTVKLEAGTVKEVVIRAKAAGGRRVFGSVTAGGEPVAGVVVSLIPHGQDAPNGSLGFRSTQTGADGGYELKDVAAGDWTLHVQSTQVVGTFSSETVPHSITVAPDQDLRFDVQLSSSVIEGTVVAAGDGRPLSGVRVVLDRDDGDDLVARRRGETSTDSEGVFRFKNAQPGRYSIGAGGTGLFALQSSGSWGMSRVRGLDLREGDNLRGVRLTLQPGERLDGKVLGPDGAPVAGVAIFIRDEAGVLNPLSEISTDDSGSFHASGIQPGSYTIHARSKSYAFASQSNVRVAAGAANEMTIRLSTGVDVYVRLHGAGGAATTGAFVELLSEQGESLSLYIGIDDLASMIFSAAHEGRYHVGIYAPGTYRVRATLPGKGKIERSVTLAGTEQTIDIDVAEELEKAGK